MSPSWRLHTQRTNHQLIDVLVSSRIEAAHEYSVLEPPPWHLRNADSLGVETFKRTRRGVGGMMGQNRSQNGGQVAKRLRHCPTHLAVFPSISISRIITFVKGSTSKAMRCLKVNNGVMITSVHFVQFYEDSWARATASTVLHRPAPNAGPIPWSRSFHRTGTTGGGTCRL